MVAFATGIEVFGNCSSAVTDGGSSGTTSPASATQESWTMSTGFTSFPTASSTAVPANFFYIRDPADTTNEIIQVTVNGGNSAAWTVIRGACSTVPVAHAAGATFVQVISPGSLQNFKQATNAAVSAVTVGVTATETVVATYQPVTADIEAGASFEAVAYGTFTTGGAAASHELTWRLRWGGVAGTVLCEILTGTNTPALVATTMVAGASFDVNGTVTLLSTTTATANLNLFCTNSTNSLTVAQLTATATNATAGGASSSTAVTIAGNGPLVLTFQWSASQAGNSLTATAPLVYRAA